jgi:predicted DNA-binding transcriptional regulator YafY
MMMLLKALDGHVHQRYEQLPTLHVANPVNTVFMQDPVMRVLTVLEILQARDSVSGAELARRLEVDLRTVQRYIVRLRDLSIPIDSTPGVGGAYRLRPGFRLPPLVLTNEEAFALSLGLRALRQIGLEAFAPATEGALAKLERVLPQTLRESVRVVEETVALEPSMWAVPTSVTCLITAATAIRAGKRVRFSYESHAKETSQREVEPYAVLHIDDRWYLIGRCLMRKSVRTFRLDRVTHLSALNKTFVRPQDFDARSYMAENMPFVQSRYQVDVWVKMSVEEARQSFALWRVSVEPEEEGTRMRCGRDDLEMFAAMLLTLNRPIVVRSPKELRETFLRIAQRGMEAAAGEGAGSL